MAANYIAEGDSIEVTTPSGGYTTGQIVKLNDLVGVSYATYAEDETAVIMLEGIFTLPKKTGVNFTAGAKLYYLLADEVVTNVASQGDPVVNNAFVGFATETAINGDTETNVLLAH